MKEASTCLDKLLEAQPEHAAAWQLRGRIYYEQGHYEAAINSLKQAISLRSDFTDAYFTLGIAYRRCGLANEAIAAYQHLVELEPNSVLATSNLGVLHAEQGQAQKAIECFQKAIGLDPHFVDAHYNLGNLYVEREDTTSALSHLERVIELAPHHLDALRSLGCLYKEEEKFSEAIECFRRVVEHKGDDHEAHNNLGYLYRETLQFDDAEKSFKQAIELCPGYAEAYNNLGCLFREQAQYDKAREHLKRAVELNPNYAEALFNLGGVYRETGALSQGIQCCQQALAINPNCAEAHSTLGNLYLDRGLPSQAIQCFQRAIEIKPQDPAGNHNLLFCLHYINNHEPAEIYNEHRKWAERIRSSLSLGCLSHKNGRTPERRLRIGYVSGDFKSHSVAYFFEPLLTAHNRGEFDIICYANNKKGDETTARLRQLADGWREIALLKDDQVAELIREDRIDILVDLSGHTAENRLLVFARKPAPVQVSYIGYPDTTGLDSIDYRLTDAWADPIGQTEQFHSEQLKRLPHGFLCYQAPGDAPDVRPSPFVSRGYITFGSFNNANKITPNWLSIWGKILNAVPKSRLLLKSRYLGDTVRRDSLLEQFQLQGVDKGQLELVDWLPDKENHLELYSQIDIALDTYPYHGTTTTCEALWMGVPVITLAGKIHVSRVGVSLLSAVGLEELIAQSPDEYVQKAIGLANNHNKLEALRSSLRHRMQASPLTNASLIAKSVEDAYRTMWRHWCAGGETPPPSEAENVCTDQAQTTRPATSERNAGNRRTQLIAGDPAQTTAEQTLRLAKQHHEAGRWQEAEGLYQQVLAEIPSNAEALHFLGLLTYQTGKAEEGIALMEQACTLNSSKTLYASNVAQVLWESGQHAKAIDYFERALRLQPGSLDLLWSLASVQLDKGDHAAAIQLYQQILQISPEDANAYIGLGNARQEQGELELAAEAFQQAIRIKPDDAHSHYNLGNALRAKNKLIEAIEAYQQAILLKPDHIEARNNLGNALKDQGRVEEAVERFLQACALDPGSPEVHYNLGNAYYELDKLSEAIGAYQRALELKPSHISALNNLGRTFTKQGNLEEAAVCFKRALALQPDHSIARDNWRVNLVYSCEHEPASIFAEHRKWAERIESAIKHPIPAHQNDRTPGRRLRIGYVSGDFRTHSVAYFFEPLLSAHNDHDFEIFCYSNNKKSDETTQRLRELADGWRDIATLNDDEVADLVRQDSIDILIDLSGHTAENRLLVFARKPAPIQVSYIGYPDTTGLSTIDYRLTDSWADPGGQTEKFYTEQLVRLPHGFLCYQAPSESPQVSPPPYLSKEYVAFGSFNNLAKIRPQLARFWADILNAVPNSRLLLKSRHLTDVSTREYLHGMFERLGISSDRLQLIGWLPDKNQHLGLYSQVDIALDTYPYHGTTTTCEALWMGVPVITLAGETHVSRVGVSLLSSVGLEELIAHSPEEYIQKAVDLANNSDKLQLLRNTLRQRMNAASLSNAKLITESVEDAYRKMWKQWCDGGEASRLSATCNISEAHPLTTHAATTGDKSRDPSTDLGIPSPQGETNHEELFVRQHSSLKPISETNDWMDNVSRTKAVFAGCCRDCEEFLPSILRTFKAFSEYFQETAWVICENDSIDDTKLILHDFQASSHNIHVLEFDGLSDQLSKRTERLAYLRNAYIDYIRGSRYKDFDILVVLDFDDVNTENITVEAFMHSATYLLEGNAIAIFANSLPRYYDIWALRHQEWCPQDCWKEVRESRLPSQQQAIDKYVRSRQVRLSRNLGLLQIESAFGGLGIYRMANALRGHYIGLDEAGNQTCEHVSFNRSIKTDDAERLLINTSLTNKTPENKPKTRWISVGIGGRVVPLECTFDHKLDVYMNAHPLYDRRLPLLSKVLSDSYPDCVFIDIGANIGDTACLCRLAGCRLPFITIEPSHTFYTIQKRNIARHRELFGKIDTLNIFIGETGGSLSLNHHNGTATVSKSSPPNSGNLGVPVHSLDIVKQENIGLLKIDTDGYDCFIVNQNRDFIRGRLPIIWIEADCHNAKQAQEWVAALEFLTQEYESVIIFDNFGFAVGHGPCLSMKSTIRSLIDYSLRHKHMPFNKFGTPTIWYLDLCFFPSRFASIYNAFVTRLQEFDIRDNRDLDSMLSSELSDLEMNHHGIDKQKSQDALGDKQQSQKSEPNSTAEEIYSAAIPATHIRQYDLAIEHLNKALKLEPDNAQAYLSMGNAYHKQGQTRKAIAAYQQYLADKPDDGIAYSNLGVFYIKEGQSQKAVECFQRAIELKPNYVEALNNLGSLYREQRQVEAAIECFQQAVNRKPNHVDAYNNLTTLYLQRGQFNEARKCLLQIVHLKPDWAQAHFNLGQVYKDQGRLEEALQCYQQALALEPGFIVANMCYLFYIHCSHKVEPQQIYAEHRKWAERHAEPLATTIQPLLNDPNPERRLRIGYVSGDLKTHSVASFLEPLLGAHNHHEFEIICYANNSEADTVTSRMRQNADSWREIHALSDEQVSELIRQDQIDILVDLSGHNQGNRLLVFARKPAPVQVTYIGYPDTTGLKTIDYRLTDAWSDPIGETEHLHTEKLVRLPHGFLCYQPPAVSPDITAPPVLKEKRITFASFNQLAKINDRTIRTWADILNGTPQSRLLIKGRSLSDQGTRDYFRELLEQHGIDGERVDLRGWISDRAKHLALYSEVDIALDTFPYNGTTTTCEALWMGVPVLTLAGQTHVSRVGVSLLSSVGLEDLIAQSPDDYVQKAITLASDLDRLQDLRKNLRSRMETSPLCDANLITKSVEDCYRTIWRSWCASEKTLYLPGKTEVQDTLQSQENVASKPSQSAVQQAMQLAKAHHQAGRLEEAEKGYQAILTTDPNHAEALHFLGVIAQKKGKPQEAIKLIERALTLEQQNPVFFNNLAHVLWEQGQLDRAIDYFQKTLELRPHWIDVGSDLALAYQEQGNLVAAAQCYQKIIQLEPDNLQGYMNLGHVLQSQGKSTKAINCYRRALHIKPDYPEALNNLGNVLAKEGKIGEAIQAYQAALELNPSSVEAHNNLGNAFKEQGKPKQSIQCYQRALELKPDYWRAQSNMLFNMHYCSDYTPLEIYEEHQKWAECHAAHLARTIQAHTNDRNSTRRLRIGYVSGDFRTHSVAYFVEPLLAAHDHQNFEIICYANNALTDATTQRLQHLAEGWRRIHALSDQQVADLIRQDQIDILVDLSGHTGDGRLLVFARKPAPVQLSYIGYPDTTGLKTIDYRFTDSWADPVGQTEHFHSEQLVRLPHGFLCYQAPTDSPAVTSPPVLANNTITFGSFNALAKVSPLMVRTWAHILKAVPKSHLLLKSKALVDPDTQHDVRELFQHEGIEPDRLELSGWISKQDQHLAFYSQIDIALDTFPYNGTTTTCEALWMGVPVITLAGQTHVSRVGVSLLSSLGHEELIAESPEDYIKKAVALADDREQLEGYRTNLRKQMQQAPLTNGSLIAHSIEDAYQQMWQEWCSTSAD